MSAFWGIVLILAIAALVAWLLKRGSQRIAELPIEQLVELYKPSVQPEPEKPKPAPPVTTTAPQTITLRLVSEAGRTIKNVVIPARQRRPAYRYSANSKTVWVFNVDSEVSPGVWIYRRVGKERA